jgi:hypothetical protein
MTEDEKEFEDWWLTYLKINPEAKPYKEYIFDGWVASRLLREKKEK